MQRGPKVCGHRPANGYSSTESLTDPLTSIHPNHRQIMSQENGILSILCANRQRNHEFIVTIRASIVQAVESGRTYRDVAAEAKCSPQSVANIFQRWKTQHSLDKKPRPGRPRSLSFRQIQYVLVSLKRDRCITYESLVNFLGAQVSRTTIRRAVRRH